MQCQGLEVARRNPIPIGVGQHRVDSVGSRRQEANSDVGQDPLQRTATIVDSGELEISRQLGPRA